MSPIENVENKPLLDDLQDGKILWETDVENGRVIIRGTLFAEIEPGEMRRYVFALLLSGRN